MAHGKTAQNKESLRSAREALRQDDDLRRQKIERLRAAIADGTYTVTAEALAEKMMEHMDEPDSLHPDKPES